MMLMIVSNFKHIRKKLQQFAEMKEMRNVIEEGPRGFQEVQTAGKWRSAFFENDNPIVLELGCGRGDYVMALAERHPDKNFIGIDVKGARMYYGARDALTADLNNVMFLRIRIERLEDYFDENEVDDIWITFADPFPPKGRANRRLTNPKFLGMYSRVLREGGVLRLKHDDPVFFDYSEEMIREFGFEVTRVERDLYGRGVQDELLTEIQTTYEKRHLAEGRQIFYLEAKNGII